MSSISDDPNGRRTIQFTGPDRKRHTIRLGKVSRRAAESVRLRIDALLSAALTGTPIDADTSAWLGSCGDALRLRLERAGLVGARANARPTVAAFVADYLERRAGPAAKPNTAKNLRGAARLLTGRPSAGKRIDQFTKSDARDWLRDLLDSHGPATAGRTFRRGAQFFADAVERELIARNPFSGIKSPPDANKGRQAFVPADLARRVIDAERDPRIRLAVALARFGGLRVPSELVGLTWDDVRFGEGRFRVLSPKTEHHPGRGERWCPLFPELRPYLEEARDAAPPDAVRLFPLLTPTTNLGGNLARSLGRLGIAPWPKLFVNLRSSRETELAALYPITDVAAWLGNTPAVAAKHYLQPLDDSFARAAREGGERRAAESAARALHIPTRTMRDCGGSGRIESAEDETDEGVDHALSAVIAHCNSCNGPQPRVERSRDSRRENVIAFPRAAKSDVISPEALRDALRSLPPADRLALAAWLAAPAQSERRAA